jgi:chorismate mutase/prephenate dehydratase
MMETAMTTAETQTRSTDTPALTMTAAFEGIEGAYSHVVLEAYAQRRGVAFEPLGCSSFRAVAHAVLSGRADVGLVPVDNAIAGTIREGYDILAEYELDPLAEITLRLEHRLVGLPGATLEGVREIESHAIVLAECGRFLGTLPDIKRVPVGDTAIAARNIAAAKDPTHAAICSQQAAERYGLVELAGSIADHPDNTTRFILFRAPVASGLAKEFEPAASSTDRKTSLIFSVADKPSALARSLDAFGKHGLNVSKLDSKSRLGTSEFAFYADVDGDVKEERFNEALRDLKEYTSSLHIIGSYDAGTAPARVRRVIDVVVDNTPAVKPSVSKQKQNFPKVTREPGQPRSKVRVGNLVIEDGTFIIAAGPCSVESREQVLAVAHEIADHGATLMRGGAFKPRTSPYSFQGMGWEGLALLAEAGRETGMPIVSEVMSVDQVERMAQSVDMFQIGARNMQNFDLLKAVGKTQKPVLLKRGMSASIDELLSSAEYIMAEGNPDVVLCERGIRTFETATRNTLDLSAVAVLREKTHLPIMVDPSHGVGVRRWIRPLCRAAKAVGANGILIEVHPNPAVAKSDAEQALTFQDYEDIVADLARIPFIQDDI